MKQLLDKHDLILIEAAVIEQLRRSGRVQLHPRLVHAHLLYDKAGRNELRAIFQSYIDIARDANLPLLLCTPTWRANGERVRDSGVSREVNGDATRFLNDLRDAQGTTEPPIKIGGLIGCKNDCYKPEEGLTEDESEAFHSWQINHLADAGVDFLIAETLPNPREAVGIAKAMAATGVPYLISWVINRGGRVLDGTPLPEAGAIVDAAVTARPLGFMVNCAHPSFLRAAEQPSGLFERLIGYQANAADLDHADLDGSVQLQADDVPAWGQQMLAMNKQYGVKILGGCCGTGVEHLRYLAANRG